MTDLLRSLDAEVSNVLGNKVVGWETCVLYDGSWTIMFDMDADGFACDAELSPIYQDVDHFEYKEDVDPDIFDVRDKAFYEKYKTDIHNCTAVPRYSKDANEALAAWEEIYDKIPDKQNYTLQITKVGGSWACVLFKGDPTKSDVLIRSGGTTLPESLCVFIVAAGSLLNV